MAFSLEYAVGGHLNGILEPSVGEVRIGTTVVSAATAAEVRRRVALVFQDPDDQLFMPTVHDDVAFGPANAGLRHPLRLRPFPRG